MLPTMVFICPIWNYELEELIQITKNSFHIKIITQKQNINFDDPYIEVLQCLETYSPIEISKLIPWLIQLSSPQFHLILTEMINPKQLTGIGALMTMIRALPQCYLTHSPWPKKKWPFILWQKAFQNLFDGALNSGGTRLLSLPKIGPVSEFNTSLYDELSEGLTEVHQSVRRFNSKNTNYESKQVNIFSSLWVFPFQNLLTSEALSFVFLLLRNKENHIEIWNWDHYSLREKNKVRNKFYLKWDQFKTRKPRLEISEWSEVRYLVLTGHSLFEISEKDLLDLVITHKVNILMDSQSFSALKGPWIHGDTFWLWNPSLLEEESYPWNSPQAGLSFKSLSKLETFRDQLSNQILRSLSRQSQSFD